MAKVPLRVYNHEIEGLIEDGHLDEAVAHCQHILKTFPMHVETYRLLGKSFLEARRYTDANDIFQRALMAVPDDFVAHVGMSIICDDEGKLDDAIWHMERAFEDQPSNPAIQGELRRLYGRRDGIEPPKIRLSRDALANMYSQGELFNQAIAEIRAVLAEDTNRPDLQIMLARAYYHAGQKVEAAEIAANLLKKYTYCMDALRILVDVLPGTARTENTQVYRQRLRMLDPYSFFATGSAFSTEQVPDTAVNLERLEYMSSAASASPQPNWASSLGIKLTDEKRAEPAPDSSSDSSGLTAPPTAGEKPVPDWMRTAGWQESRGKETEGPADLSSEQPAEPLAPAEIPDWLKSMAPQEMTEAQTNAEPASANPPSSGEGDSPDWLKGLEAAGTDARPEPSQPAASSQDNDAFPDWLKEIDDGASAGAAAAFAADALEQPQAEKPPVSTQPVPPLPLPPATRETIKPSASAPRPDEDTLFQPTGESKPLNIEDDAMAWLESLAAKQGANEEELLTKPEDRLDEMPDWLHSAGEQPSAPAENEPSPAQQETLHLEPLTPLAGDLAAKEPAPSEELPPVTSPAEGIVPPLKIEDDNMTWLEDFAAKQGANEEELLTKPEDRLDEMPDWLHSAGEQSSASAEQEPYLAQQETLHLEPLTPAAGDLAAKEPAPSEELPQVTSPAEGIIQPLKIEDDNMTWLEDFAAKQGDKQEELPANPEKRSETPPDGIQNTTQEPATPEKTITPENLQEDITITSWLRKQDVEKALGESQPAHDLPQPVVEPSNELPDWLKELEKPAAQEEAPNPDEILPDWLTQPAQPADQEVTAAPTDKSASEPDMSAWIDEPIPVAEPPAPTTPGEWVPVDEKPAPGPDVEPIAEPVLSTNGTPILPQFPRGTGRLSLIPAQEKDAELLNAAQAALGANHLNEAMQTYSKLIKKNRLLDEVIQDLREAIYRFPVDVIVWQTLGDASMRANRLQDALDAYTKAEELLR